MRSSLMWRSLCASVTTLSLAACASDDASGEAALGSYAGTPASPAAPAPPNLGVCPHGFDSVGTTALPSCQPREKPELPRSEATCPTGWEFRQAELETHPMCRPRLPSTRCPDNQRIDLSSGACVDVGERCSSDGSWPADLPADAVYLRAGSGGYGVATSPYGDFAQAFANTPDGGVLVIGPGTYAVNARVEKRVTIVGVCPEQVVLEGPESTMLEVENDPFSIEGTFEVRAPGDLQLKNVTLRGRRVGLHVQSEARATVQGVRFDQNTNKAIIVDGGSLDLRDAVVERTLPLPDGRQGRGLQANLGARVTIHDVTFQDNDRTEVAAFGAGSSVGLFDVVLQNTRTSADADGQGAVAGQGGALAMTRAVVRAKRRTAIAGISGGRLTLAHAFVPRTLPDAAGQGVGLFLNGGAQATVTDSVFLDNTFVAVYLEDSAVLTGSDISIANTLGKPSDNSQGRGINAIDSQLELDRVLIDRSNETGVVLSGSKATFRDLTLRNNDDRGLVAEENSKVSILRGSSKNDHQQAVIARSGAQLELIDFVIDDVERQSSSKDPRASGINCLSAKLNLQRVAVRRTRQSGLFTQQCEVDIEGLVVEDTKTAYSKPNVEGRGVFLTAGKIKAQGVIVRRAHGIGMTLGDGPPEAGQPPTLPMEMIGRDILVEDTLPTDSKEWGVGVGLLDGARGTLTRVAISRSRTVGVMARHDSEVKVTDLTLRTTVPEEASGKHGFGVISLDGARLELERALIADSYSAGVTVSGAKSRIKAADLTVLDTRALKGRYGVGVGVYSGAGFDLERGLISRHHAAGLLVQFAGAVKARDLTISDIRSGTFISEDIFGINEIKGAGDCILGLTRSVVEVERASLSGCSRVGLLFDDASGSFTDVRVQEAPVGVALQGFPRPEVSWSSVGVQQSAAPLLIGSDLAVPASSPPILDPNAKLSNAVRTQ